MYRRSLIFVVILIMLLALMGVVGMFIADAEGIETEDESDVYIPVYTEHKSKEAEEYLWNELSKHSPSDEITAAVLGMFWRESFLQSNVVAGAHVRVSGESERFTAKIDKGISDGSTRDIFVHEAHHRYGGYGLGQWIGAYLERFYDFVQEREGSIGDAAMQCEFTINDIRADTELWKAIRYNKDPLNVARRIAVWYDGASTVGVEVIASMAKYYYETYAE